MKDKIKLLDGVTAQENGTVYIRPDPGFSQTLIIEVEGISTATVQVQGRLKGGSWYVVPGFTDITADGLGRADISGFAEIRAAVSAYTSGTINAWAAVAFG
jgi:hypothetical protein